MKLRSLIIAVIGLLSVGSVSAQANLLNSKIPEQVGMKTPEQLAADNDSPCLMDTLMTEISYGQK